MGNLSDDEDKHPLLTGRMGAGLAILAAFAGIGVPLMLSMGSLYIIGSALCIFGATLIFWMFSKELRNMRMELWGGLVLIVILLALPIVVYAYLGSPSEIAALRGQIAALSRLRWTPLTEEEIISIKHSVAGTRPTQPTMTIKYLDANAYDLAESFNQLFSDIGFKPQMLLEPRLSGGVGLLRMLADERDAQLVTKIINSIEDVTRGRMKCELQIIPQGEGPTRILIGQKVPAVAQ
jgi:hypothetical protein